MNANATSVTVSLSVEELERGAETEKYLPRYRLLLRQARYIVAKYPAKSGKSS